MITLIAVLSYLAGVFVVTVALAIDFRRARETSTVSTMAEEDVVLTALLWPTVLVAAAGMAVATTRAFKPVRKAIGFFFWKVAGRES